MVPVAKIASLLVLAAVSEKSKTPFYIAGAALAAWAVLVSAMGLRRAEFPGSRRASRAVMGVSAVLVATAIAMALVTASRHERPNEASAASPPPGAPAPPGGRPTPAGRPSTVSLAADPSGQLRYDKSSLKTRPGKVTVAFANQAPVPHNVTVESAGKTVGATQTITGSATKVALALAPGTYTYFCSVDAHRQAGMQGTLVVG
ncbi:MAG: hypothetical protein E6G56_07035 [Actinobacteria bacterium]|nr:MAG: hypothetical protein E6G56_07035 [Actinomycetota bacterium]